MRASFVRIGMVALVAMTLTTACGGKKPGEGEGDGFGNGSGANSEFDEGLSERDALYGGTSGGLETVYFDYDQANIRSEAASTLRGNAETIANRNYGSVTLEGHCDERGSEEYNLALGEKRANAVKRYLVDLGVASSNLQVVSFGESQPAVQGHDESAWQYNRRVEFRVR